MKWRFGAPIRRVQYQRRQAGEHWVWSLRQELREACAERDFARLSVVLNNTALLLFKANMVAQASGLCRAHYAHFAPLARPDLARLAVQPWINEGRLLIRLGQYDAARLRISYGATPVVIRIGMTDIELDAETVSVCRVVAAIDGFQLELKAGGLDAADAYLSRLLSYGGPQSSLLELKVQSGLARGDAAVSQAALDQLWSINRYLPTALTYGAAISSTAGDMVGFVRHVLVLAALVGDWATEVDDLESVLHALVWLRVIEGEMFDAALSPKTLAYIERMANELGDQELVCLLRGERYDPAPPGSRARDAAELLFEDCQVALDRTLGGAVEHRRCVRRPFLKLQGAQVGVTPLNRQNSTVMT